MKGSEVGAEFLLDLPSRGYFINIEVGSAAFKLPRPYVCDHETDPPANQILQSDPNMPILRKQKVCSSKESGGKRKLSGVQATPEKKKPKGNSKSRRQSKPTVRRAE